MKIYLTVKDRLIILNLLPTKGNIEELIEISSLYEILNLTELEKKEIELEEKNSQITWNSLKEIQKEFNLNFNQIRIIKDKIQNLNADNEITIYMLDTCLKFNSL